MSPIQTPFPISGIVTDVNSTVANGFKVEIFNLRTGDLADGTTDSNGVYIIELANFPNFARINNDPLLIRSYKGGKLFRYAEITATLDTGAAELVDQDLTLVVERPIQPKDDDQKITTLKEHHITANAKKVININNKGTETSLSVLERYDQTDEDSSGIPEYYGFTASDGSWYIQEYNTTDGTYRYTRGNGDYIVNWNSRDSLTYDYLFNIF